MTKIKHAINKSPYETKPLDTFPLGVVVQLVEREVYSWDEVVLDEVTIKPF